MPADGSSSTNTASTVYGKAKGGMNAAANGVNAAAAKMKKGWEDYPADTGKAGQIQFGCLPGAPKDAPYINRLKSDLANSYYWSGNIFLDYLFFVANWHPAIGMFTCHPNHPWDKKERIEMFVISLLISLVPSCAIGAYMSEHGNQFKDTAKSTAIICFVTIPDIVWGVILYQLAIADTRCPNLCGKCLDGIKKCCICYIFMLAAISTGICWWILSTDHENWTVLLGPLIEGRVLAFVTWFPLWILLPCQLGFLSLWCSEKKAAQKAEAKRLKSGDTIGSSATANANPVDGQLIEGQA